MGHCMFLRKGETHTAPLSGILASDIAVGSTVKLMENGVAVDYLVVNQGIPGGSSLYDSSCDGMWVLRKDCHSERTWDSTDNDYENSDIHAWLNGDFFNSLGSIEQTAIKQVKIPYRQGAGYGTTITSGANGLSTKVFLLSSTEAGFIHGYSPSGEGSKVSYFSECIENGSDDKRIAYINGTDAYWWLRSPCCNSGNGSTYVLYVYTNGDWMNASVSTSYGIRPALILPSTALFDKNTLILKGVT